MTRFQAASAGAMLAGLLLSASPVAAADIQIIDAGTFVVNGRTVRLWGVEAPDARQTCVTTTGRSWPCGAHARDQLRSLVQEDEIVCQPKAPGLELCRIAGFDIGALLVKEGLAKARGDYEEIEARARSAHVGLWE